MLQQLISWLSVNQELTAWLTFRSGKRTPCAHAGALHSQNRPEILNSGTLVSSQYASDPCQQHLPRMTSLRSGGIPVQSSLRPSTISRHSSLHSRSDLRGFNRYARRFRILSKGEPGGAAGIKRTKRDRISPAIEIVDYYNALSVRSYLRFNDPIIIIGSHR